MKDEKRWPYEDVKHMADTDLRMVQVAAVAAGREALRLAVEVETGRLPFHRAAAVLAGPLGFNLNLALVMLGGSDSTMSPMLRAAACLLLGERGATMGKTEARAELAMALCLTAQEGAAPIPSPPTELDWERAHGRRTTLLAMVNLLNDMRVLTKGSGDQHRVLFGSVGGEARVLAEGLDATTSALVSKACWAVWESVHGLLGHALDMMGPETPRPGAMPVPSHMPETGRPEGAAAFEDDLKGTQDPSTYVFPAVGSWVPWYGRALVNGRTHSTVAPYPVVALTLLMVGAHVPDMEAEFRASAKGAGFEVTEVLVGATSWTATIRPVPPVGSARAA